jgi:SAM-dependent methyltransferase
MDIDPEQARYGAEHHVVASLTALSEHFPPAGLDAIVCSGVIGYGLDDPQQAETAIAQCYEALRPGGLFILGYDDSVPFAPQELPALLRFEPTAPPPFPAPRYPTFSATGHTFDFYARPA